MILLNTVALYYIYTVQCYTIVLFVVQRKIDCPNVSIIFVKFLINNGQYFFIHIFEILKRPWRYYKHFRVSPFSFVVLFPSSLKIFIRCSTFFKTIFNIITTTSMKTGRWNFCPFELASKRFARNGEPEVRRCRASLASTKSRSWIYPY